MRAIFLNSAPMALSAFDQKFCIKFAYWLATRIGLSPMDDCSIHFREFMTQMSARISIPNKFKYVIHRTEEEEDRRMLEKMRDMHKVIQKQKHKPPQLISLKLEMEQSLNGLFNAISEEEIDLIESKMPSGMKELAKTDFDLLSDSLDLKNWEPSRLTHLLKLLPDAHDEFSMPGLFFLPVEYFLDTAGAEATWVSPDDAAAADPGKTWFYPAFDFVPIVNFPAASMQAVREHTAPERDAFCEAMGRWITNAKMPDTTLDDIAFFNKEVRARADALNRAIKGHVLMKPFAGEHDGIPEFLIGSMPVADIWRFFQARQATTPAVDEELAIALQDPVYQRRWPVLAVKAPRKENAEQEFIDSVIRRKFISLD